MLYACLLARQTCNLLYTVGILMNVITHAQFDVVLFCSVFLLKLEVSVVVFRSRGSGSVWFSGVRRRTPQMHNNLIQYKLKKIQ